MSDDLKIDYIEFTSPEPEATQRFFGDAFGWDFIDYGPDYQDIQNAGTGGGIARGALRCPLIVLKTSDLQAAFEAVKRAGGEITKEIFDFPGGKRFEFREPGGAAMAVWSEGG